MLQHLVHVVDLVCVHPQGQVHQGQLQRDNVLGGHVGARLWGEGEGERADALNMVRSTPNTATNKVTCQSIQGIMDTTSSLIQAH